MDKIFKIEGGIKMTKLTHRDLFQSILDYPALEIEKSITKYAIEKINPQCSAKELSNFSQNANEKIVTLFKDKNFPLCFEKFNFLFESILDENYKNKNGIVFTPKYISDFICKNTFSNVRNIDSIKIIDPSCGCGIFLISAIEIIKQQTNKSIKEILKNQIFGLDISEANTERVKILLKIIGLMNSEIINDSDINICCADSLKENWNNIFNAQFNYIIGNPPYVNPHSLSKEQSRFLKQNFQTTNKGVFNIFYAFIEQSMKFINKSGKVSFIVPNNFLTISAAKPLRDFIEPYLLELIDLQDNMVFKPIRTYNAIITLGGKDTGKIKYSSISRTNDIGKSLQKIEPKEFNKKNVFLSRWRFLDSKTESNISKIENQFFSIAHFVTAGIATLKDEVYRVNFNGKDFIKNVNGVEFIIDKELVKPIYKIPELKNSKQCGYFIFPYKIINRNAKIIDEKIMQTQYLQTYNYLLACKNELDSRDKGKQNAVAWYAYGRTQCLNRYGRKLLFGTFALNPNFILIDEKDSLFCNGYALFENDVLELEILQKILNSCIMKYYIRHTSYQIEGGYFCYQKKYIEKFSFPFLDTKEKNFLLLASAVDIDNFLIKKYGLEV